MADSDQTGDSPSDDTSSFRQLFVSTYPQVVAYVRRRSHDRAEIDDVVSEVYAAAWRRRLDLSPDGAPLPWLYGIAANVLRNHWRAGSRRLRLVDRLEAEPHPETGGDPAERPGAEIRAALDRLSFDDQEVLRLVAWEGLSHAEVGQVLGCTTNAVGIRVHRARQRLEAELTPRSRPADTPDAEEAP